MLDKVILNKNGTVSLIYTDRAPFNVSGSCAEHSLQLAQDLLDWSTHFDRLDACDEVTQEIDLRKGA